MDLKADLNTNKVILITLENASYNQGIMELTKSFSGEKVIYVVINKSYSPVDEDLKKNGVNTDSFYYINMARGGGDKKDSRVYQMNSVSALTELAIIIERALKTGYTYIFFDSITNLLVYNNASRTKKFVIDLTNKIKASPTSGVYYALDSEITGSLIKELGPVVDKTIKVQLE